MIELTRQHYRGYPLGARRGANPESGILGAGAQGPAPARPLGPGLWSRE